MPYHIMLRTGDLLQVTLTGQIQDEVAEAFFEDVSQMLDDGPSPMHMLVDGRGLQSASRAARRRLEQIGQHPHLGQIAFVVGQPHMFLFAPIVRFVGGVGLFADEQDAIKCLRAMRNMPVVRKQGHQDLFERAVGNVLEQCAALPQVSTDPARDRQHGDKVAGTRLQVVTVLPTPAIHPFRLMSDMIENLNRDSDVVKRSLDHVKP